MRSIVSGVWGTQGLRDKCRFALMKRYLCTTALLNASVVANNTGWAAVVIGVPFQNITLPGIQNLASRLNRLGDRLVRASAHRVVWALPSPFFDNVPAPHRVILVTPDEPIPRILWRKTQIDRCRPKIPYAPPTSFNEKQK